ncbi:MAG: hypothetical protein L3J09_02830 [Flavobacteriaceae bacterium]|nr:hypothetical protein [Flavobacteriaceae bacterium]
MLKSLLITTFILSFFIGITQPNTEIYLLDIAVSETEFTISNFKNISNNEGYDSQPSFADNNTLLYARTHQGQTDIARYVISENNYYWINHSTSGGEYSPQNFPKNKNVTAVRLDTTGLQRLYKYDFKTMESTLLIEELQVAYYSFFDEKTILSSVLSGNNLDLVISNVSKKINDTLVKNVGRSIHKVPNTKETMSYTSVNEDGNMDIYQLDIKTLESFFVAELPIGIQDHIWLDDSNLLIGSRDKLFMLDLFGNGDWKQVADFSEYKIKEITRLAISPDGKKLAIVAETEKENSNK